MSQPLRPVSNDMHANITKVSHLDQKRRVEQNLGPGTYFQQDKKKMFQ